MTLFFKNAKERLPSRRRLRRYGSGSDHRTNPEVLDLVAGAPRVAVDALVRAAAVEIHGVNKSEPGVGMPHAGKERLGLDLANPHAAMVRGLALLGKLWPGVVRKSGYVNATSRIIISANPSIAPKVARWVLHSR